MHRKSPPAERVLITLFLQRLFRKEDKFEDLFLFFFLNIILLIFLKEYFNKKKKTQIRQKKMKLCLLYRSG